MSPDHFRALIFGVFIVSLFAAGWFCSTLWASLVVYWEQKDRDHRRVEDE